MEAEQAMGHFKKMKQDAEQLVSKVENFQGMAARFVEEASETLNATIIRGEEYLVELKGMGKDPLGDKNPLFRTLIQLIQDDLRWFRVEGARLSEMRRHYAEMSHVYADIKPAFH